MKTHFAHKNILFLIMVFCSGAAALIYETIWIGWFRIVFGNTAYAAAVTLAAFFTGLSIGAVVFGRISQNCFQSLRIYGWLEIGIILTSLMVPFSVELYEQIYPFLYDNLRPFQTIFIIVKFFLAFIVILPTSFLLGGTMPLMVRAFLNVKSSLGKEGNRLYAINTFGAVLGTAMAGLWLPEILGVNLTYVTGMVFSLISVFLAFALNHNYRVIAVDTPEKNDSSYLSIRLMIIAAASGFGTLSLQVLLMQALSQMFDNSVYSVGAVLIVVLLSVAVGAALISVTVQKISAINILKIVLFLEAILVMILPWVSSYLLKRYGFVPGTLGNGLFFAMVLGGPALFIGSLVFPLTLRLATGNSVGRNIGYLMSANTLGSIAGSIIAGFYLLKILGIWLSLVLLGIAYGLSAVIIDNGKQWRMASIVALIMTSLAILLSPANPVLIPAVSLSSNESLVDYEQGPHGVISVVHREVNGDYRIKMNNHYTLSGSGVYELAERGGHIPLLLHPQPETVAFIGSATGITAGSAMAHEVDTVELIELVPEVQELASKYFGNYNRHVYQDQRTDVITEDGRNHLQATRQKYDVVVADLFVPWRPGVGSLYTKEHFQAVRDHLESGGIFCQWLPVFQLRQQDIDLILNTFNEVFSNASLWRSNFSSLFPRFAIIGRNGAWPSRNEIEHRVQQLGQRVEDQWVTNSDAFWMLFMGPLHQDLLSNSEKSINTDNHPLFEFQVARSTYSGRASYIANDGWLNFAEKILLTDVLLSDWPKEGSVNGQLYARTDAQFIRDVQKYKRISRELKFSLEELQRRIPKQILKYDPTLADVSIFFKED